MLNVTQTTAVENAKQLAIQLQLGLDRVKFAIENTEYNYMIDTELYAVKRLVEGCK